MELCQKYFIRLVAAALFGLVIVWIIASHIVYSANRMMTESLSIITLCFWICTWHCIV